MPCYMNDVWSGWSDMVNISILTCLGKLGLKQIAGCYGKVHGQVVLFKSSQGCRSLITDSNASSRDTVTVYVCSCALSFHFICTGQMTRTIDSNLHENTALRGYYHHYEYWCFGTTFLLTDHSRLYSRNSINESQVQLICGILPLFMMYRLYWTEFKCSSWIPQITYVWMNLLFWTV